jgi:hypothetical protein
VLGFRFVLELRDGDVADPAMFITAIPTWHEGDEFLAGCELQRFRILSVHADLDPPASELVEAVWVVEPVGRSRPTAGLV